ncbi:MAG: LysE family translocator [Flavobacteriaceae bacterium]|nr:LysE family translocator [Flavobacteriaceae bacterium]
MEFEVLISFLIASIVLTLSPGPDIIYVLMQSISNGKKYGIMTALGLVTGIIIHTTLVAFGVSALINKSPNLFFAIKLFGSIYMLYLAYKVLRSSSEINLNEDKVPKKTFWGLFKQGFLMNVLNPKVTLFFLSFLSAFLFSDDLSEVTQFYVLGILFMIQAFVIFTTVSYLSGTLSNFFNKSNMAGLILKHVQVVVFVCIAIFIMI